MLAAAQWFEHLKATLGIRASMRIVSRIKHIFYALLVAAAWAYPLHLVGLRVFLVVVLLLLNFLM